MKEFLAVAFCALSVSHPLAGQTANNGQESHSKAEQEVKKVHDQRLRALAHSDVASLDTIVGEDLVYVSPVGKVQAKADIVADLKSGALKVSSIAQGDEKVRVYGDVAVVNYTTTSKFMDNGKAYDNQIRSTSVYLKRHGRWELVSQQMTRVAQ